MRRNQRGQDSLIRSTSLATARLHGHRRYVDDIEPNPRYHNADNEIDVDQDDYDLWFANQGHTLQLLDVGL